MILPTFLASLALLGAGPFSGWLHGSLPPRHPHHPKKTIVTGVHGKVTLSWFTVPFNAQKAKELEPGYEWNRGFRLVTEVPLQCGGVTLKAGSYGLGFRLGKDGSWSTVLHDASGQKVRGELRGLTRRMRQVERGSAEATELRKKIEGLRSQVAAATHVLPSKKFAGEHAEHLTLYAINYGITLKDRRDATPVSGVEAEVRVSFGDLHTSFRVLEQLPAAKSKEPAGDPQRRGK
ncbi:MAG: hypothetical protein H6836_03890 [Planctomycetes bacterium]|nr:hypothetical protein [Planctomycetota bacterium]MCB9888695.1 hypothetical protein [Planctomycetota bacterium]